MGCHAEIHFVGGFGSPMPASNRIIGSLKRLVAFFRARKVELGLGIRVTVAAMTALIVALGFGLKLPLWAVLTAIIVTQMSVGRSLKATRDYLVGTIGGAIYGGAVAILIPHTNEGALLAVLGVAGGPPAVFSAHKSKPEGAAGGALHWRIPARMKYNNPP